jgi:tetratricopeptide (TPR) repeat protein
MESNKNTSIVVILIIVACLAALYYMGVKHEGETLVKDDLQPHLKPGEVSKSTDVKQKKSARRSEAVIKRSEQDEERLKYLKALEDNPEDAMAYFELGNIDLIKGKYSVAIRYYDEAYALNPKYPPLALKLGDAYSALDKIKKANQYYNIAIKLKPKYYEAYYGLANNNFKTKNYKATAKLLNVILTYSKDKAQLKAAKELKQKTIDESGIQFK